jgi:hypothetical protein
MDIVLAHKPCFPLMPAPHTSLRSCQEWSAHTQIPCDGVIFIDARVSGYGSGASNAVPRLWKLKESPSIDFAVCPVVSSPMRCEHQPSSANVFELMLRGPCNTALSLHRFQCNCHGLTFQLPVLIQPSIDCPPLRSGQVIEMTCRINNNNVQFVSMQPREAGKQANFIWAAMDIVHAGYDVDRFLHPMDGTLVRVCIRGPLREARNAFTRGVMQMVVARSILEIGGGSGGDLPMWLNCHHLAHIDVVDPDADALGEYMRRLNAFPVRNHVKRPVFKFHTCGIFDLPDHVGWNADCAVLHFSISQIVGSGADAHRLIHSLCTIRKINWVIILVHDHVATGLPRSDDDNARGIQCEVIEDTGCVAHPLIACECAGARGHSAILRTRISGTRMAADIREFAFSSEAFISAAAAVVPGIKTRLVRPFFNQGHWILRSLTLVVLNVP